MNNNEFDGNFERINRYVQGNHRYSILFFFFLYQIFVEIINAVTRINESHTASSTVNAMDVDNDSMDCNIELNQMEREIDEYKSKLRNCRDKYENMETEICNTRQLQSKALFVLDNVQPMEEDLHERFKNIHVNYEACVVKSGGYEDLDETLRAKINELAKQRNALMEELTQLRKNADDNDKKLARVKAMVTEQEVHK